MQILFYICVVILKQKQMNFLSKDFYKEFYKQIDDCEFEEDEQVELEIEYLGETLIIYGIARFKDEVYTYDQWMGSYIETTQSTEREFYEIEITKIEKV